MFCCSGILDRLVRPTTSATLIGKVFLCDEVEEIARWPINYYDDDDNDDDDDDDDDYNFDDDDDVFSKNLFL